MHISYNFDVLQICLTCVCWLLCIYVAYEMIFIVNRLFYMQVYASRGPPHCTRRLDPTLLRNNVCLCIRVCVCVCICGL